MPLLGKIIQQCRVVFAFEHGAHRPSHAEHSEYLAQLRLLQEAVDQLRPHNIGLDEEVLSSFRSLVTPPTSTASDVPMAVSEAQRRNRVAYYPILEEAGFEIGLLSSYVIIEQLA